MADVETEDLRAERFKWWKETFLAALSGLSSIESMSNQEIVLNGSNIANMAGARLEEVFQHFVTKGLIGPQ